MAFRREPSRPTARPMPWERTPSRRRNATEGVPYRRPCIPLLPLTAHGPADPDGFYFSPACEVEQLQAERTAAWKTNRYDTHMERNAKVRVKVRKRPPAEPYYLGMKNAQ